MQFNLNFNLHITEKMLLNIHDVLRNIVAIIVCAIRMNKKVHPYNILYIGPNQIYKNNFRIIKSSICHIIHKWSFILLFYKNFDFAITLYYS